MPFNVEQLRKNVSPDWNQIVPSAVRAQSGDDDIFIGDMFVTGGFTKGMRQTNRTIRVSCVAAGEMPSCDLVKIDTEGSEVEILRNVNLVRTQAILLEHHSKADAATIKQILMPAFRCVHDESDRDVGTMIFVRHLRRPWHFRLVCGSSAGPRCPPPGLSQGRTNGPGTRIYEPGTGPMRVRKRRRIEIDSARQADSECVHRVVQRKAS